MPRATLTPANLDATRTKTCFFGPTHQEPGATGEGARHDEAGRTTITHVRHARSRVARLAAGTHAGRLRRSSSSTATTPPAAVGSPSTASAVAGSPSPGHAATASSIGDGVYLVGTDIPAGSYKGTTVSDTFGVWQIASDANGSSIIASDPATSGQFYVQVKKGQYLKLCGCGDRERGGGSAYEDAVERRRRRLSGRDRHPRGQVQGGCDG